MIRICIFAAAVLLASCAGPPAPAPEPQVFVGHRPPLPKDIIEAVMSSQAVALKVSSTCANAGTEPTDKTIGRYLAGFMANMADPGKTNWVETKSAAGTSASGEAVWICDFVLRHEDGDDRWGWGVRFEVRQSDGLVLAKSFQCTGAG